MGDHTDSWSVIWDILIKAVAQWRPQRTRTPRCCSEGAKCPLTSALAWHKKTGVFPRPLNTHTHTHSMQTVYTWGTDKLSRWRRASGFPRNIAERRKLNHQIQPKQVSVNTVQIVCVSKEMKFLVVSHWHDPLLLEPVQGMWREERAAAWLR